MSEIGRNRASNLQAPVLRAILPALHTGLVLLVATVPDGRVSLSSLRLQSNQSIKKELAVLPTIPGVDEITSAAEVTSSLNAACRAP